MYEGTHLKTELVAHYLQRIHNTKHINYQFMILKQSILLMKIMLFLELNNEGKVSSSRKQWEP